MLSRTIEPYGCNNSSGLVCAGDDALDADNCRHLFLHNLFRNLP
jgi:hypothetical protein